MREPIISEDWPRSWRESYVYDRVEVFGACDNPPYSLAYRKRQQVTLGLVTSALRPGSLILDAGAAQGNFSILLAEEGYRVVWNDLREDLIGYVKLKHEFGEIDFCSGDLFATKAGPFDGIVATEIIEHVAHPDQFLAKLSTLLKPGGFLFLTTPNGAYFNNRLPRFSDCSDPSIFEAIQFKPNSDGHIFLLYTDEIHRCANAAGLRVDTLSLFINPLTTGHIKLRWLHTIFPTSLIEWIEWLTQRIPDSLSRRINTHLAARLQKTQ